MRDCCFRIWRISATPKKVSATPNKDISHPPNKRSAIPNKKRGWVGEKGKLLLELPFPLYSNATGDVKTMRRLWDKFKQTTTFLDFWDTRISQGKASRPYKWRAVDRWRPLLNEITRTPLFSLPIMSLTKSRCRATIQGRVVAFHNFLYIFLFLCFSYYQFFFFKNIISLTGALIRLQLHSAWNPFKSKSQAEGRPKVELEWYA